MATVDPLQASFPEAGDINVVWEVEIHGDLKLVHIGWMCQTWMGAHIQCPNCGAMSALQAAASTGHRGSDVPLEVAKEFLAGCTDALNSRSLFCTGGIGLIPKVFYAPDQIPHEAWLLDFGDCAWVVSEAEVRRVLQRLGDMLTVLAEHGWGYFPPPTVENPQKGYNGLSFA